DRLHLNVSASCAACHGTIKWKPATFDHRKLTASSGKECLSCHKAQKPQDRLHLNVSASCAACHGTIKWKPATFDHRKLTALSGKECISCHRADQPNDNLHSQSVASCGTCHSTGRWEPATFNHSRYFSLDGDHSASCKTCHTDPANYKKYTCYNCHEHTLSNIAAEHREEGISNYQNCVTCHRNGTEGSWREDD
ncbi:MAG: cytochrome c3 family protein, partial [Chlorobiaceae bacterium]|nr:cytochrome c3 family protein [Chlorobiaceae bacterium]